MLSTEILSIPSVQRLLALHLDSKQSLSSLMLTCNALHNAYAPHLWRSVYVRREKAEQMTIDEQEQLARRVGDWVKLLSVGSLDDMGIWVQQCLRLQVLEIGAELSPTAHESWYLVGQCIAANRNSLEALRIFADMLAETPATRIGDWIKMTSKTTTDYHISLRTIELFTHEFCSSHVLAILDASPHTLERCILHVDEGFYMDHNKADLVTKSYPGLLEFSIHVYDTFMSAMDEDIFWALQFPVWCQSPNLTHLKWSELSEARKIKKMLEHFELDGQQRRAPIELDFSHCMLKPKYIARIIAACQPHSIRRLWLDRELESHVAEAILSTQNQSLEELHLVPGMTMASEEEEEEESDDEDASNDILLRVLGACPRLRVMPKTLYTKEPWLPTWIV